MSEDQAQSISEEKTLPTKSEVLSSMRFHQAEYAKHAADYKAIQAQEDYERFTKRQVDRLEEFKSKYKFYADEKTGEVKEIDWVDVEKLVTTSFSSYPNSGYALGYNETGMPGFVMRYGTNSGFHAMVEEEADGRKFAEREVHRMEYLENSKKAK